MVAQVVKNLPAMQEAQVISLGWEDALEREMATHSNILAWRILQTEENFSYLKIHVSGECRAVTSAFWTKVCNGDLLMLLKILLIYMIGLVAFVIFLVLESYLSKYPSS